MKSARNEMRITPVTGQANASSTHTQTVHSGWVVLARSSRTRRGPVRCSRGERL